MKLSEIDMDSETLYCCLKTILRRTKVKQHLVLPKNKILKIDFSNLPCAAIVNTDDSNQPGTHWFCIYVYRTKRSVEAEFYDSYGNTPESYGVVFPYKILNSSSKTLQSLNSDVCGLYCLHYFYYKARNFSTRRIQSSFTDNLEKNDKLVKRFYGNIRWLKFSFSPYGISQKCCLKYRSKFQ